MSVNLLTHGIAVLELPPQEPGGYICSTDDISATFTCSPEFFCNEPNISYEVNYEASVENIYNWYTKFDLVCLDKSATSNIAISCLVGVFVSVLFIPRLGDLYGRKPILYTGLIVSVPALVLVAVTTNLLVLDIASFLAGPCIIARMACGFLMLMEHMETKH